MKNEFSKSILFVVVFFVMSFALSFFYTTFVMKDSILNRIDHQFDQFNNPLKYLIVGDSHSQSGLDPAIFGDSFNYSSSKGGYVHTYYKLKYIFDRTDKKIDTVILSFDAHSFSSWYLKGFENSWYWRRYIDFSELGRISKKSLLYFIVEAQGYWTPYIGQRDFFLRYFSEEKEERDIVNGYIPMEGEVGKEGLQEKANDIAAIHFKKQTVYDETLMNYFWKTLELCDQHHVNVVLVRFPVTSEYLSAASPWLDAKKDQKIRATVEERFPHVKIIDQRDVYNDQPQLFKDPDHLNREGALKFSKLVKEEMKNVF